MRTTVKATLAGSAILAFSLMLAACGSNDSPAATTTSQEPTSESSMPKSAMPDNTPKESAMPDAAASTQSAQQAAVRTGDFEGIGGKTVAGSVTIGDGKIMLSGFSSDEGPDLHLYLANGTDEAAIAAGTEIDLVAYDEASQTFMLDGVDAADFTHLVVNCDKAKAVFGAATLS